MSRPLNYKYVQVCYDEGYQQGKVDAIDEFMHYLIKNSEIARPVGWNSKIEIICMSVVRDIAEQLKENKND